MEKLLILLSAILLIGLLIKHFRKPKQVQVQVTKQGIVQKALTNTTKRDKTNQLRGNRHNNRKRTRGRDVQIVSMKDGRTRKLVHNDRKPTDPVKINLED